MLASSQAEDIAMTIDIPEDIALRLEALAKQNDADISDLLRDLLERYEDIARRQRKAPVHRGRLCPSCEENEYGISRANKHRRAQPRKLEHGIRRLLETPRQRLVSRSTQITSPRLYISVWIKPKPSAPSPKLGVLGGKEIPSPLTTRSLV